MTGLDFITRAMRKLGAIDFSRTPTGAEADNGLITLNHFMELLSIDRFTVYTIKIETFSTLVSGQQQYTIGPGGDLATTRPTQITQANIILTQYSPTVRIPLKPLNDNEWGAIQVPGIGTLPQKFYYDGGFNASGQGIIYLYPFPQTPVPSLELFSPQQLTQFPDLTTDYTFPPGYAGLIEYGLAAEMMELSPPAANLQWVKERAAEYRERIGSLNAPAPKLVADAGLGPSGSGSTWNYITGES